MVVVVLLLAVISILNLTTAVSSHPVLITVANVLLIVASIESLYLLYNGRYDLAAFIAVAAVTLRVLAGTYIKLDLFASGRSNDNIYFMFSVIAFTALFGSRRLFIAISLVMIAFVSSMPALIAYRYQIQNVWPYMGAVLNINIALIVVSSLSLLVSKVTENALCITQEKLDNNRLLSDELSGKVLELQSMYEEMEYMNTELADTSKEIWEKNLELKLFKEIAEASTQGFMISDLEGKISYMNPAMRKIITGSESPDIRVNHLEDVYPENLRGFLKNAIIPEVLSRKNWSGEMAVVSAAGAPVQTLQNAVLIKDDAGSPRACAMVVTDLTQMKKLEAQLMQSQKLEAVGRLAGGIAHDFNNYLTAIIGYSSLIISRGGRDDPAVKDAMEILRAAENSTNLVRQLLTFSRGQMLRPVVLNVNEEIKEMINMLERLLGETITIVTDLDDRLANARLDPAQVEQVILNLAINARDAMPDGGRLTIRTENVSMSEADCLGKDNARSGEYICLTVTDTGVGIPADQIENIFVPFFSTKEAGKGSGLGLAVIYGIVKQHDGWIHVESEMGKGSSFKICFSAVYDSVSRKQKHDIPLENLSGRGERILLVEDHEEVRRFATAALSKNGYQLYEATTVYEAITIYEEQQGDFQLVFSDVVLPDKSGIEFVRFIKENNPAMPVLLCSGYTELEGQSREIVDCNYAFLQKPYTMYDLLDAIHRAMYSDRHDDNIS
ncbi:MAG: response regulator [Spirochaetes bacterium]|nr:response regulator [Spirochaetota bacterium]